MLEPVPSYHHDHFAQAGVAFLAAILAGRRAQPAIERTLRFGLKRVTVGEVEFEGAPGLDVYNPIGTVHGGYAATLLDSAMSAAVHSALPAGRGYTTLEFKVNLVRPITASTGCVTATGRMRHLGRRTATSEGSLTDKEGRLLASGTATCFLFDVAPPAPPTETAPRDHQ